MTDEPLHVQVARALGCKPDFHEGHGWWLCGCGTPEHIVAEERYEGPPLLVHFDTDWSATGPLIEKYGLAVGLHGGWWAIADPGGARWMTEGPTPLVTVCLLILKLHELGKLQAA
jgi:hypothetical protein